MKNKLVDQVREMMVSMPDTLAVAHLEKRKDAIFKIANAATKYPLFKKTEASRYEFYKPLKNVPTEKALLMCWVHFLDRMAQAPTARHMEGVVILCFPILADILRHKERYK